MRFFQITLLLAVFSIGSHAQNNSPLQREVQSHQLAGKTLKATPIFRWDGDVGAAMRSTVSKGHLLQLDAEGLKQAYQDDAAAITLQIPIGAQHFLNLKLIQHDLLAEDFKVSSNGRTPPA